MAGHEKNMARADREARRLIAELGRELRVTRLNQNLSQRAAARAAGFSHTKWGNIEWGRRPNVGFLELARAFAVVGLDLSARAYPAGDALRDEGHGDLLEALHRRVGSECRWMTEVPLPNPGDRRAWDAMILIRLVRVGVEAETRARDAQDLERRLRSKRRDGGVDHVILLLADTRHNRAFLRAAGAGFLEAFDVDGRTALQRLERSEDPGGSAIILLPPVRRRRSGTRGVPT